MGTLNRREFIKSASRSAAATLSFPWIITGKTALADTPPNVVFIICDQMRGDAMSCLGSTNARTPNLDRMASGGVLMNNFFANNPVCGPSRMSFFTGLWPHQHGKLENDDGKPFVMSLKSTMLGHFRDRGYRTGWIGKNHTYTDNCLRDLNQWIDRGREPFRAYSKFVPPFWHSDTLWPEKQCHPRMTTNDGIEFIRQSRKKEPFFLHLSYFDPHPPYMAPSEFTSRYCSKDMTIPPFVPPEKLSGRLAEHVRALHYDRIKDTDLTETMRYYYAAIEWGVDFQVGRILEALEENDLIENTIVVFSSDHGDFMGHHRMVRKGMFLYDSLLHVPMIFYAPARLPKGHRVSNISQGVDLFPTLVDLTGGNIPEGLPGRSLRLLLEGGRLQDRNDFSVFAAAAYSDLPEDYFDNPEPAYKPDSDIPFHTRVERLTWKTENRIAMARTLDWKLIVNESRPPELYNMAGGRTERENVAENREYTATRASLERTIESIWKW